MPDYLSRPLSRLELLVARNTQRALHETAQATLHVACDVTDLLAEARAPGGLSLSTRVYYATLQALKAHPDLNARLSGDELLVYTRVRLGLMLDSGQGVLVGCLHEADACTPGELEVALRDLRESAREGKMPMDHTRLETFLVADLSSFAVDTFTPILLPGPIAILGIGRVRQACRPVPGGYETRSLLSLSLTIDHRGTDGIRAGRFLTTLVGRLENPSAP